MSVDQHAITRFHPRKLSTLAHVGRTGRHGAWAEVLLPRHHPLLWHSIRSKTIGWNLHQRCPGDARQLDGQGHGSEFERFALEQFCLRDGAQPASRRVIGDLGIDGPVQGIDLLFQGGRGLRPGVQRNSRHVWNWSVPGMGQSDELLIYMMSALGDDDAELRQQAAEYVDLCTAS